MTLVRRRLDPSNPPRLTADEIARLDALTPDRIARGAADDPDNPPLSKDELARLRAAAWVARVRATTGLSQTHFAAAYRINVARLRGWEQARFAPDSMALAYLAVIARAPDVMRDVLGGEARSR